MTTLTAVNKELKRLGRSEVLERGNNFYHFTGGLTKEWRSTCIYNVKNLRDFSLDQMMGMFNNMRKHRKRQVDGPTPWSEIMNPNGANALARKVSNED